MDRTRLTDYSAQFKTEEVIMTFLEFALQMGPWLVILYAMKRYGYFG